MRGRRRRLGAVSVEQAELLAVCFNHMLSLTWYQNESESTWQCPYNRAFHNSPCNRALHFDADINCNSH